MDARPDPVGDDPDTARCRTALYEALALGFGPPSPDVGLRLGSRRGTHELVTAAERLDSALPPLVEALAETDASPTWLRHSHRRLFGDRALGQVAPCESEYEGDDLFCQLDALADITSFYGAFGRAVAPEDASRPDHVADECAFMAGLARREAAALAENDPVTLAEIHHATRLFLRDHLGRFVPTLAEHLQHADGGGFYAALGALAAAFVRYECDRAGVLQAPATLGRRSKDRPPRANDGHLASATAEADAKLGSKRKES